MYQVCVFASIVFARSWISDCPGSPGSRFSDSDEILRFWDEKSSNL